MTHQVFRCRVCPLPGDQASFQVEGVERLRWHFGRQYPRPFFYPLLGPSGEPLTRMGHPGAPNHDHHRSIWFAHHDVGGVDFWSDQTAARIRQKQWLVYDDGQEAAVMAVRLGWHESDAGRELVEQDVIASMRPLPDGETLLELQTTLRPGSKPVVFGQTNFGFLAVRVAKTISEHFGGGQLTNSDGAVGEDAIFAQHAVWMDYSGPVLRDVVEGITYFDHPTNPGAPSHWHVRSDGWMGASACMSGPITVEPSRSLTLRYLLHAHRGSVDAHRARQMADQFAQSPACVIQKSRQKHRQFEIRRVEK